MSYIQSRIRCDHCQRELNVAFGIVGTTQIAGWPTECPTCQQTKFTKITDGWEWDIAAPDPAKETGSSASQNEVVRTRRRAYDISHLS